MAPACVSPMLTPGYAAGDYWEDGVSLRVVANGEWVGERGPRSWNIGEREGDSGCRNELSDLYRVQFA